MNAFNQPNNLFVYVYTTLQAEATGDVFTTIHRQRDTGQIS